MHDIRAIRAEPDAFDAAMARRSLPPQSPQILRLDAERRALIAAAEARQARVLTDGDIPGLVQSPNQVLENTQSAQAQQLAARASSPVAPRPINAPPPPTRGTFFLDPLL